MRSDKLRDWLDSDRIIPNEGTDEWDALSNEDRMIVAVLQEMFNKPNGALFNAVMANRYGQMKAGDGAELEGEDDFGYDLSFGTNEDK